MDNNPIHGGDRRPPDNPLFFDRGDAMPAIPPSNPLTPDAIGIRALNLRTADGTEPTLGGGFVPAGRVSITITPGEWSGESFVRDRPPVPIPDVVAWLTALAVADDPLAGEAAARFASAQADLLWLLRLHLSADGVCPRPTA